MCNKLFHNLLHNLADSQTFTQNRLPATPKPTLRTTRVRRTASCQSFLPGSCSISISPREVIVASSQNQCLNFCNSRNFNGTFCCSFLSGRCSAETQSVLLSRPSSQPGGVASPCVALPPTPSPTHVPTPLPTRLPTLVPTDGLPQTLRPTASLAPITPPPTVAGAVCVFNLRANRSCYPPDHPGITHVVASQNMPDDRLCGPFCASTFL